MFKRRFQGKEIKIIGYGEYLLQWRRQLNKWGDIFIYSCSAQLISFEIESVSKEINCAECEYMNMSPSLIKLATPLICCIMRCQ